MMFRNWTGDDKVTHFLRWDAHKTIDDTKSMIQQWINNYQYDFTYYWGIYLKNSEMIGSIGITITSEYDFKGGIKAMQVKRRKRLLIICSTIRVILSGYSYLITKEGKINISRFPLPLHKIKIQISARIYRQQSTITRSGVVCGGMLLVVTL